MSLWRRLDGEVTPEQLEQPGDDPRELSSVALSAAIARGESAHQVGEHRDRLAALTVEAEGLRAELDAVRSSTIMRVSEPARRAWYRLKRG
jgi:hypothetical protein